MFFDFFNILVTFQKFINRILAKKLNIFIIIYLDNILIYIEDLSQPYIEAICLIFRLTPEILFLY